MDKKQIDTVIDILETWVKVLKTISEAGSLEAAKGAMRQAMESEKAKRLSEVSALVAQMNADGHSELKRARVEAGQIIERARQDARDIISYVTRPKKRNVRQKQKKQKAKR